MANSELAVLRAEGDHFIDAAKQEATISLMLRASIAIVPLVGGALSVIVENHLARQREERLNAFIKSLQSQLESRSELEFAPNALVEKAARKAADDTEGWKPRTFARILGLYRGKPSEQLLRILIDHVSQLTDYDLANFLSFSDQKEDIFPANVRYAMHSLEQEEPVTITLRELSIRKLEGLGFLAPFASGAGYSISALGQKLIDVLR